MIKITNKKQSINSLSKISQKKREGKENCIMLEFDLLHIGHIKHFEQAKSHAIF